MFTFALGTAAGDLLSEKIDIGYFKSILVFAAAIVVVALAYYGSRVLTGNGTKRDQSNAVIAFWLAYILTRPLGASIGDYLSQAKVDSGIGLGTTVTSVIFLGVILTLVVFLTKTKKDEDRVVVGA